MKFLTFLICISIHCFASSSPEYAHIIAQGIHENASNLDQAMQPGNNVATIGFENSCDFRASINTIQDVINHADNYDEIRIVQGNYNKGLTITNKSINLRGGYANCADAEMNNIDTSVYANIDLGFDATTPGLVIYSGLNRETVNINNIKFISGTHLGLATSGGINTISADLELNLINVNLELNNGTLGGGISIQSGQTNVTAKNLSVYSNHASSGGGGIYCSGNAVSFTITNNNDNYGGGIWSNTSDEEGGGVMINEGCTFSTWEGISAPYVPGFYKGIHRNTAITEGGGIYVKNGGVVNLMGFQSCVAGKCLGDNNNPININDNSTGFNHSGNGGGIYATGSNSQVNAFNVLIQSNTSRTEGGGISLANGATFRSNSVMQDINETAIPCWNPKSCNMIIENKAHKSSNQIINGIGGAIIVKSGSNLDISNTIFQGNRASYGTVLNADSSTISFEGNLFTGNGSSGAGDFRDRNLFNINNSNFNLSYSTIADNNLTETIFYIKHLNNPGTFSNTQIKSSIISDLNTNVLSYSSSLDSIVGFDCVITHETSSMQLANSIFQVVVADPTFIDPSNKNYHINAQTSPAVDFCDGVTVPVYKDIDNEERGWDDSSVNNHVGPYDIGYDETYQNDVIFKSNLE